MSMGKGGSTCRSGDANDSEKSSSFAAESGRTEDGAVRVNGGRRAEKQEKRYGVCLSV